MDKINVAIVVVGLLLLGVPLYAVLKPMFQEDPGLEVQRGFIEGEFKDLKARADEYLDHMLPGVVKDDIIFRTQTLGLALARSDHGMVENVDAKVALLNEYRDFLDGVYKNIIQGNFRYV